jgi:hypothetical protein
MNDEREQSTRPAGDGEPVQPVHPNGASGLAAYRWLLRRLFAGDATPPPVEDSSSLLALPPTEPDESE